MRHENVESLDALLTGACILLNDAAALQKKLNITPEKDVLHEIAKALFHCWNARDLIYNKYPQLKPEFMSVSEQSPELETAYGNTIEEAAIFEQEGHFAKAIEVYKKYLEDAPAGFYRRSIEFRVENLLAIP
jgi:hypothetical protein